MKNLIQSIILYLIGILAIILAEYLHNDTLMNLAVFIFAGCVIAGTVQLGMYFFDEG